MSRRLNGTGTLINKGHGKPYLARWSDGKGHVIYRTTGETRRSEALKVLAQFVRPFQEDHEIKVLENLAAKVSAAKKIKAQDEAEAKGIELDEIADHIDKNLAFADTTASSRSVYKGYVVTLVDWMKANRPDVKEMKDVTEDDARAFLEGTVDKVCSNLYNFRLVLYRRLWRVLQSDAHCSENPWMKFNKRKAEKHSMRRELTREELAKIFKFVKDDDEMTLAFATGLYTGLRRGDVCDLKWSEVDFPRIASWWCLGRPSATCPSPCGCRSTRASARF